MTLTHILGFVVFAFVYRFLCRQAWRGWVLLGASVIAIYWLQPPMPIRYLDFWLPTMSLGLAVLVWAATRPTPEIDAKTTLITAALLAGIVLAIGLNRYLGTFCCLLPSRPPGILSIALVLAGIATLGVSSARLSSARNMLALGLGLVLVGLFVVIKTPSLAENASAGLRLWAGQSAALASPLDIRWLGFSYLAFRLLHVLRDRAAGRLPDVSLGEFITYALFFPAYTAGPIDRVQHFVPSLRQELTATPDNTWAGSERLIIGIFKKFVLADSLALVALNEINAGQVNSTLWLWLLLYAYALRIYLDFSGYTDIAIGLGLIVGLRLPENFDRPYLRSNLTAFWNSWHITLAQWFRAYFFNPLTRFLRGRALPVTLVILISQVSTMLLIGLWHGVTWNFAAWGLWHGIGLFAHNRWTSWARGRLAILEKHAWLGRAAGAGGALFTFHYVTLGWVWFAIPLPEVSWQVFIRLFGTW